MKQINNDLHFEEFTNNIVTTAFTQLGEERFSVHGESVGRIVKKVLNFDNFNGSCDEPDDVDKTITADFKKEMETMGLSKYIVDFDMPSEPQKALIKINGVTAVRRRNISTIKGDMKSFKSTFTSILIAAALGEKFDCMECEEEKCRVLYVDTEQDASDIEKIMNHVNKLKGWDENICNPRFVSMKLRDADIEDKLNKLEYFIRSFKADFVVIDGIRGFTYDINNSSEATKIINFLIYLADTYNCALINVIHTNKGKNRHEARGHLGTELMNYSETVFDIVRKDSRQNFSVVSSDILRGRPFEPFVVGIDEDGHSFIDSDVKKYDHKDIKRKAEKAEKAKKEAMDKEKAKVDTRQIIREIFKESGETEMLLKDFRLL